MINMLPTIPGNSIQTYLNYIHSIPVLSASEEQVLLLDVERGCNDAAHKIILHHLRFVAYIAHKYRSSVVPIEDCIQEGNLALLDAVKKYNTIVSNGARFATYAVFHIKTAILQLIRHNYRIIDIVTTNAQKKLFNNKSMFKSDSLDNKEAEYIATTLNVDIADVVDMHAKLTTTFQSVVIGDDGVYDVLPIEDNRYDPELLIETFVDEDRQRKQLEQALLTLNDRDRQIIQHRFLSEERLTQTEVGKLFNISCERVRQIETRIIQNLRNELNVD